MSPTMPDFTRARPTASIGSAVASLERMGIDPDAIEIVPVSRLESFKGEIVGQVPAPGEAPDPGGTVTLFVAHDGIADRIPHGVLQPISNTAGDSARALEPGQVADYWERYAATLDPGRQLVMAMDRQLGRAERDLRRLRMTLEPIALDDGLALQLLEIAGIETPELRPIEAVFLAAAIQRMRSFIGTREGICHTVSLLLRVDTEIVELPGERLQLPENQRHGLGADRARLGESLMLGPAFIDPSPQLHLRFGPLRAHELRALDQDERWHARARVVLDMVIPAGNEFDYELVLDPRDRSLMLGDAHHSRLGRSTYLSDSSAA